MTSVDVDRMGSAATSAAVVVTAAAPQQRTRRRASGCDAMLVAQQRHALQMQVS